MALFGRFVIRGFMFICHGSFVHNCGLSVIGIWQTIFFMGGDNRLGMHDTMSEKC